MPYIWPKSLQSCLQCDWPCARRRWRRRDPGPLRHIARGRAVERTERIRTIRDRRGLPEAARVAGRWRTGTLNEREAAQRIVGQPEPDATVAPTLFRIGASLDLDTVLREVVDGAGVDRGPLPRNHHRRPRRSAHLRRSRRVHARTEARRPHAAGSLACSRRMVAQPTAGQNDGR